MFGSGVKFTAKETPQGPLQAVKLSVVAIVHGLPDAGVYGSGILPPSGCPESSRSVSSCGPFGPNVFGVWQSWQPPAVTSTLPRSTGVCAATAAVGGAGEAGG